MTNSKRMFERRLALVERWWLWRRSEKIRRSANVALMVNLRPIIEKVFEENRRQGRGCVSWKSLAVALHHDSGDFLRIRDGHKGILLSDVLATTTHLGIDTPEILPTASRWLADVTRQLCDGAMNQADATLYAEYRLSAEPCLDNQFNHLVLHRLAEEQGISPRAVEEAILRTAARVGAELATIADEESRLARASADLIRFVNRESSAEDQQRIEDAARDDEELAAEIGLLMHMGAGRTPSVPD